MTDGTRLLLPVNWRNAFAFYARGLIVPGGMLTRCHKDLLELAPRHVPLLIGNVSESVADTCAPTPRDFPVILEIDGDVLVRGMKLNIGGTPASIAPAGVIPTNYVHRVHVRFERDRREFQVRRYRNVDTTRVAVSVTQPLFEGTGVSAETLRNWLRGLPEENTGEGESLVKRECAAGALMLVLASIPPEEGIVEDAGHILEKVLDCPKIADLCDLLPNVLAEVGWISVEDDHCLCAATLKVLMKMSGPEPPVPSEVVGEIRRLLVNSRLSDESLVSAYLDRILAINRGDVEFTSFRQTGGLRAAKGLLLFLLRSDPTAAKSWLEEDINADHQVVALAAIFAGIAHRSTGLPNRLRGGDTLKHLLSDWIASGTGGDDITLPQSPTAAIKLVRGTTSLVLTTGSEDGAVLARYNKNIN